MALPSGALQSGGFTLDADGRTLVAVQGVGGAALTFGSSGDYPSGATAITGSSGNVAAATATATLAGAAAKTTYITGFQVTASGATGATVVNVTVANTVTGNLLYVFTAPAGVTTAAAPLNVTFSRPVPANAVNTAITVSMPTLGSGNTNAAVSAQGYQL